MYDSNETKSIVNNVDRHESNNHSIVTKTNWCIFRCEHKKKWCDLTFNSTHSWLHLCDEIKHSF
ncbi:hypothetical protein BLOT_005090, partial [Blomia tropicalis]